MATKAQSTTKAETPAAVKAAAARKQAPKVVTGPKGKKLEETKTEQPVTEDQRKGERRQAQTNATQQFAPTTQTTPAVHELTEEEKKAQAFQAEIAKLAEQYGVPVPTLNGPKQARSPKPDRTQQNNVTRPAAGTKCAAIWDLADKISHDQQGHPALISQLNQHPSMKDINGHTIKTQYARWRQFHGIKGRVQLIQAPQKQQATE